MSWNTGKSSKRSTLRCWQKNRTHSTSCSAYARRQHDTHLWCSLADAAGPTASGAGKRFVLCGAVAGSGSHFWSAEHYQFHAWRVLYAGRLRGLDGAAISGAELLAHVAAGAADCRAFRHPCRTPAAAPPLQAGSLVWLAAYLRPYAAYRRPVPQFLRGVGASLRNTQAAAGGRGSGLHV